jgi:hypothetical protein
MVKAFLLGFEKWGIKINRYLSEEAAPIEQQERNNRTDCKGVSIVWLARLTVVDNLVN